MFLVIVIVVIVVLAAVVFLAMGRGGELSVEPNDYAPLDLGPVSATDIALLRPPTGLWGYNMQATDEAMDQIADSIRERDVRIVALEQLVTDLSRDHAPMQLLSSPYAGARHRRAPVDTAETEAAVSAPSDTVATEQAETPYEPEQAGSLYEPEQAGSLYEPEQAGSLYEPEQAGSLYEPEQAGSLYEPEQAGSLYEPEQAGSLYEPEQAGSLYEPEQAESPYEPEQARFPIELPRPSGAVFGPPPEQSHD